MNNKKNILIYRDHLLPISETFIKLQAESLKNFVPYYVGSRHVPGLNLSPEHTYVVNKGGIIGKIREISHLAWRFDGRLVSDTEKLNPKLLHAHFGVDGVNALDLKKQLRIPLVVTFHGFDVTTKDEYARRSFYRHKKYIKYRDRLKHETEIFIAVSKFIREKLIENGFPSNKIIVHHIGVNIDDFQPQINIQREPIVLFVGRLVEKKGCEYLIRAMEKIQTANPEIELVVIGDGELRVQLELLAKQYIRRYRFLGYQPVSKVKEWMSRAKVFCVPSIVAESGDTEALGIVFIEAQAMGLPVVSFASGGIPEAVIHGKTGYLAPEKNWHKLADYITHLLQNEQSWYKLSLAAQQHVRENFDLTQQTSILESIYESVLNNQ